MYSLVSFFSEKAMAPHSSTLAWKIPWMPWQAGSLPLAPPPTKRNYPVPRPSRQNHDGRDFHPLTHCLLAN